MFDPRSEDETGCGHHRGYSEGAALGAAKFLPAHVELNVLAESRAVFPKLFEAPPTHPHTHTQARSTVHTRT